MRQIGTESVSFKWQDSDSWLHTPAGRRSSGGFQPPFASEAPVGFAQNDKKILGTHCIYSTLDQFTSPTGASTLSQSEAAKMVTRIC